jgi:hypothetical protein
MNKTNRQTGQKPTEQQILGLIKNKFDAYYENGTQLNKEALVVALKTYIWEYSKGLWEDISEQTHKMNFEEELTEA